MFQASILEWVAFSFSKGSSHLSDWTYICIAGRFFTTEPPGKPAYMIAYIENLKEFSQNRIYQNLPKIETKTLLGLISELNKISRCNVNNRQISYIC